MVEGKSMKEHLRFSVVYWHTMRGAGADMFGWGTAIRPWELGEGSVEEARKRVRCFFEFSWKKLGAPFYAFHDRERRSPRQDAARIESQSGRGGKK